MLGYWRDAEATAAMMRGGWFVTGDRAAMAPDGWIAYRGRRDDLMNAGGYRVAPQEVEAVLLACPGVREAAVAEREVRQDVRVIAAYLVCDAAAPDDAGLAAWCAERLARYKTPRLFLRLDALPRTATGKVVRRALAQL
jgi:acyl-coenzyme A synthetase/AMP-(fatty) acid ligase